MYVVPICRLCLSFMYVCFHRSFIFVVYVCRKEDDGEVESGGAESSRRCCERVDILLREHSATTIGNPYL